MLQGLIQCMMLFQLQDTKPTVRTCEGRWRTLGFQSVLPWHDSSRQVAPIDSTQLRLQLLLLCCTSSCLSNSPLLAEHKPILQQRPVGQ
jgi:hypothetical protein